MPATALEVPMARMIAPARTIRIMGASHLTGRSGGLRWHGV
jgi:hypothetical protein